MGQLNMRKYQSLKIFLIPILVLLLWAAPYGMGAKQRAKRTKQTKLDAGQLQERLQNIAHQKNVIRYKLRQAKQKEKVVNIQLNNAEQKLEQKRQHLQEVSTELVISRAELSRARKSLAVSEANLDRHQDALSERLQLIYERGDIGVLEVLLQASSYADFENRLYMLNQFMDQDVSLLEGYESAKQEKTVAKRAASESAQQVADLKDKAQAAKEQAAEQKRKTAALKQSIQLQRAIWERSLMEMEQASRDVSAMLRRLQNTTAGRKRYAKRFSGGFLRPVSGEVSSPYGYRVHPILGGRRMHTGVDIRASSGTSIHAAAAGYIIWAGWRGGFGNCVIIDHGGGVATLYGHCSRLAVSAGTEVSQGETIGYVGSTGLSTGPHLHFEVQRNGSHVNPGF